MTEQHGFVSTAKVFFCGGGGRGFCFHSCSLIWKLEAEAETNGSQPLIFTSLSITPNIMKLLKAKAAHTCILKEWSNIKYYLCSWTFLQ